MQVQAAVLELAMVWGESRSLIYPTLIWDDRDAILVDTGTPGQLQAIREGMERLGVPFERLNKILITHQDLDHIGSLPELLAAAQRPIEVIAHEETKPYVEGAKRLLKSSPDAVQPVGRVDTAVKEGDVLPYCGGIAVIYTPGHTPDHTSYYLSQRKTLIAGDASASADGRLLGPNPPYTMDMNAASRSLSKFLSYDIETVICYHGGVCREGVRERLAELANVRSA